MPAPHFTPVADLVGPALSATPDRLDACARVVCNGTADQFALAHNLLRGHQTIADAPDYYRDRILNAMCDTALERLHRAIERSAGWDDSLCKPLTVWLRRRWQGESILALRDLTAPIWFFMLDQPYREWAERDTARAAA